MSRVAVQRVSVFSLNIPMRHVVAHASAHHAASEPVVVAIELTNGTEGYGEALPRSYVTQESVESAYEAIRTVYAPFLLAFHPSSFPEALEAIEALPWRDGFNRPSPSARACVELALLHAVLRCYKRTLDDAVRWMGIPGFGLPGSIRQSRYSGVLGVLQPDQALRQVRKMYWGGLRHFKLKVGVPNDLVALRRIAWYLRHPIRRGRATLRLDANGAWSKDEAIEWLSDAGDVSLSALEQPLPRGQERHLRILRDLFDFPIMHDESLVTLEDAQELIALGVADAFNIRISKCGGMLPSLRLAALARRSGVRLQLGCMVGETSILSAAGVRFLEVCPRVEWVEGCFGSHLLSDDVVSKAVSFGYGGRPPRLPKDRFGVTVDQRRLRRLCPDKPLVINL
ncbi:MAG: enolase C-terminal domain-like protein [Phycisphaerae bacterium]